MLDEYKEKTDELVVSQYMFVSHKMMEKDEAGHKAKFVQDFLKCSSIFDAQIKAAQAAGNQKLVDNLTAMKAGVEKGFSGSGAADCETLKVSMLIRSRLTRIIWISLKKRLRS